MERKKNPSRQKNCLLCTYCLLEFNKKDLKAALIRSHENNTMLSRNTYYVVMCQKCSESRSSKILDYKEI
ncbi:hypothetical protein EBU91_00445 [bacterium]|nr:hypothetical protein [bacterium]